MATLPNPGRKSMISRNLVYCDFGYLASLTISSWLSRLLSQALHGGQLLWRLIWQILNNKHQNILTLISDPQSKWRGWSWHRDWCIIKDSSQNQPHIGVPWLKVFGLHKWINQQINEIAGLERRYKPLYIICLHVSFYCFSFCTMKVSRPRLYDQIEEKLNCQ